MSDNFHKAREAMVVSQLQPAGIMDERVIEAYRSVPRETFLPENLKSVCYLDESIALGNGRFLLEPLLHGLMVDELEIQPGETVLNIGDDTGYSAAIVTKLGGNVTDAAESYDVILINGAVAEIPDFLTAKLNSGGRLACIIVPKVKAMGKIVIVTRETTGTLAKQVFEDATAAYVPGFEPKPEFVF